MEGCSAMSSAFYEQLLADLDKKVGELVSELLRAQRLRAEIVALQEGAMQNEGASLRPRSDS